MANIFYFPNRREPTREQVQREYLLTHDDVIVAQPWSWPTNGFLTRRLKEIENEKAREKECSPRTRG